METTTASPIARHHNNFYRSPGRVAALTFVVTVPYFWWWLWQFFQFGRSEGFPRARSFWWFLVPFYGLYVLYRQLDDLRTAIQATSSQATIRPGLVLALLSIGGGLVLPTVNPALFAALAFLISYSPVLARAVFVALAVALLSAIYMIQRAATEYVHAKYPEEQRRGFTWGEIVAILLGLLGDAGVILLGLQSS